MFDLCKVSAMTERQDRLRRARIDAGFETAKEAARHFDWNENTYSSNENGNAPFSAKKAVVYGKAFGVNPDWLYHGPSATTDSGSESDHDFAKRTSRHFITHTKGVGEFAREAARKPLERRVPLLGKVAAGVFYEVQDLDLSADGPKTIPFPSRKYARADAFALEVDGESCNRKYPHGTMLYAVPVAQARVKNGNFVVVRRSNSSGQVETTVKRIYRNGDTIELRPWSDDPRFQTSLFFDRKDEFSQEGYTIDAKVVGRYEEEADDEDEEDIF